MTWLGSLQILILVAIILVAGFFVGGYLYRVFTGQRSWLEAVFAPVERILYRLVGIDPSVEMEWKAYLKSLLLVNFLVMILLYIVLRLMGHLPLNPDHNPSMPWALAFNSAASFITTTGWQNYSGESGMTYLGQMALVYAMFVAPASGVAATIAILRAIVNNKKATIGNFWVDLIRFITRFLVPFAVVSALVLAGLGLPDSLQGAQSVHTLQGGTQSISRGPIAALEAIKQLGNNGEGFLNSNSATPFEDPTALTDIIEIFLMALLPVAFIATFGKFLKNRKQATVLYVFVTGMLLAGTFLVYGSEAAGNPIIQHALGITGANMEGKEVRFGIPLSSLFVAMTGVTDTGAVNTMHDSLTPLAGMVPIAVMFLNMIFGGAGVGLQNIIMFLIITVFLSGLMVGRTPEIFGKKIEAREIKLATLTMLVHPILILLPTAVAVATKIGVASIFNPGLHGFSEVLYLFTSSAANNGSAFGGINGNTAFYNLVGGVVMLVGRYVSVIAMFAIAGSLAKKPVLPASVGTLKTDTYAFGWVFSGVVLIVGALTFFPALVVGPLGEQIQMLAGLGH